MTCVWDALRTKIKNDDLYKILGMQTNSARELVQCLKSKNRATVGVKWQGISLKQKEMEENMKWIENHNVNSISNGYDCSTCDPYIILVCYLLNVKITHKYINNHIIYEPPGHVRYELHFENNMGHFW